MTHILAVSASPSRASRTAAVIGQVAATLRTAGHTVDVLHVRALPAEPLLRLDHTNPFVADAAARLAKADAVVIGSPVYKSAYTGLLKAWIDALTQRAFLGKPVLPLSTGASTVDSRAVRDALAPVLAGMGAEAVLDGLYLLDRLVVQGTGDVWCLDPDAQSLLEHTVEAFAARVSPSREQLR